MEIKKGMKELLSPIIDLIKALVTPSQGTKFLITVVGIGSVAWLCYKGLATWEVVAGIVAMVVAYHICNLWLTKKDIENGSNGKTNSNNNGNGGK